MLIYQLDKYGQWGISLSVKDDNGERQQTPSNATLKLWQRHSIQYIYSR